MGADIHLFVEKKNQETDRWETLSGPNPAIQFTLEHARMVRERGDEELALTLEQQSRDIASGEKMRSMTDPREAFMRDYYAPEVFENWLYDGRNYILFSVLASVRNCYDIEPIAYPRGLPDDISLDTEVNIDGYGHDHSYLTLAELLDFDWEQKLTLSGTVSEKSYRFHLENGHPDTYAGWVGGGNIQIVSNEKMHQITNGLLIVDKDIRHYTEIKWEVVLKDQVESFMSSLAKLEELSESPEHDDVRIVFYFDS